MFNIQHTIAAVQANCDIADARYARNMSLCNYLLAMREFYRWEKLIPFAQQVKKDEVGAWLAQHEAKWDEVEDNDYRPIPVAGCDHDHFDAVAINLALEQYGLVYGCGLGHWGRPNFFLAQLLRREQRSRVSIMVSGNEYARNMAAPPAALNHDTVFLRMDAMQRWLFQKTEVWSMSKTDNAFKAVLDCYEVDDILDSKLDIIAAQESEVLILHELGEAMAEPLLGKDWHEMLASTILRRHEILARAVRDNLADCLSTLPELIARDKACSLHFYFSNFDGLRRSLFPKLTDAYEYWNKEGDVVAFHDAIVAGSKHWQNVARNLLAAWVDNHEKAERMIESFGANFSEIML